MRRKIFVKFFVVFGMFLIFGMILNRTITRIAASGSDNQETTVSEKNTQYIRDSKQQKNQNIDSRNTTENEIAITLTETDNYGKPLEDVGVILQSKMSNGTWTTFNNESTMKTDSNGQIVLPETLVKLIKEKGGKEDNLAFRFRVVSVPAGYVEPPAYSGIDKETTANTGELLHGFISDVMTITSETKLDYNARMYSNLSSSKILLNNPYFYYGNNTTSIPGWYMFIGPWGFSAGVSPIGPASQASDTTQKWEAIPIELNNKINEWAVPNVLNQKYTVNNPTQNDNLGELTSPKYDENNKTLHFDYNTENVMKKSDLGIVLVQSLTIKPKTFFRLGVSYRFPGNGANAEVVEARIYDEKFITGSAGKTQKGTSDNQKWKDIYVEKQTGSKPELVTVSLRLKLPKEKVGWAEIKSLWGETGPIDSSGLSTENTGEPKPVTVEYYKDQTKDESFDISATSLGRSWSTQLKSYSDGYVLDYATLDGTKITTTPIDGIFKTSA